MNYVARVYAATCTSVAVSGVDFLDGTYEYQSFGYYTRLAGTVTYVIELSDSFWYVAEVTYAVDPQYRVSLESS